jgi:hypothetical protein
MNLVATSGKIEGPSHQKVLGITAWQCAGKPKGNRARHSILGRSFFGSPRSHVDRHAE